LLTGYKWKKKNLTYGFQYRQWNDTQKSNVVSGLKSWEKACGLTFTKTGFASASLKFHLVGNPSYPYLGNAFFPVGKNKGKIFISYNNATDKTFKVGGYDYITVIHEVGHALGWPILMMVSNFQELRIHGLEERTIKTLYSIQSWGTMI